MRFSTGIILSILSANVFAIEHLNGAHPGSLLARRAVVANTDGPFLQKRNNDGEPEEPTKPKVSPNPYSHQEGDAYVKGFYKDDPNPDPNPIDGTGEGPANFPEYAPDQDNKAFGHIKNRLSRAKLELELALSKDSALTSADTVASRLGGEKGVAIGKAVYEIFLYTLEAYMCYKGLYKDSTRSPFGLKLPSSTLSGLKKGSNGLQDDVLGRIELYISAIKAVTEQISISPKNVIFLLERIMESTDNFYMFISNAKSRYSRLSKELKTSDDGHLEGLEMHMKAVETYKCGLSGQFNKIKEMVEDHRKKLKPQELVKGFIIQSGIQETFRGVSAWLKQKRSALEHTISALHPVLTNHQLTVNYRSRIFSAVVMGKAYYGLELVGGNKSHLAPLQTTINKGIRLFTGARLSTAIGPLLVETGIGSLLTRSLVSRVRLLERSVTKRTPINVICSGTDNDVFTLNVQGQLVRSQRWFWSCRTKQLYRNRYWLTPQVRPKTVKQRHSFALMETLRTCGDSASLQKYVTQQLLDTSGFFKDPSFDQSRAHGTRYLMLARMDALWTARKAIQIGILVDTHPFSVDHCILCDQQLLSTSIAHLVVECEQVSGHRIQSGLVPAIQKSRLRLLGRSTRSGCGKCI
ncbi:hypothetical protein BASA83_012325 [Batrachochytrium salamandrivorans]|nr:hypothetical protein BASA83_012325 [Batrachochytrium salamandrivorans]